jgi:hypothetical protein
MRDIILFTEKYTKIYIYMMWRKREITGIMRKIKISAHAHLYKIYYIKDIATYTKYTHTREM